jgi:hypothetical protein
MIDFDAILTEAHAAAVAAQVGAVEGRGLDCGFAWVTIDGTAPLARYCRKEAKRLLAEGAQQGGVRRRLGDKGYPTGWQFWCPGSWAGQSVGVHERGAKAFRDALARHNISATVSSRLD